MRPSTIQDDAARPRAVPRCRADPFKSTRADADAASGSGILHETTFRTNSLQVMYYGRDLAMLILCGDNCFPPFANWRGVDWIPSQPRFGSA
jgi:hypothetical protein